MEISINPSNEILNLVSQIDTFKGSWQVFGRLAPDRLQLLKKVATIESVASSTRIEGVTLTDLEVESLLNNLKRTSFRTRDQQEVAGYAKGMELIFDSFDAIRLDENHIKQLHATLLAFSTKDERHRGEYKKLENSVAAFDENGKDISIIFKTASPLETPYKMQELLEWTSHAFESGKIHPLLVIAVFTVHFLAIHPFQDGNGRLSRILTTLLLIQCGYEYVIYSSLERIIENNKELYYLNLRRGQSTLYTDNSLLNEWITFFLMCMADQKNHLLKKLETEHLLDRLPPLSQKILEILQTRGRITNREIQEITGSNRNTIKFYLKSLVDSGHIEASGKGRGVRYSLKMPVRD